MAKKKKISNEEREKQNKELRFKEMMEKLEYMNEPTYFFDIGESAVVGNLRDVVISQIFERGKFYEITYTGFDNNYGKPIYTPNQTGYWQWTDIRKPTNNDESLFVEDSYSLQKRQADIMSILFCNYCFGLDMDVEYQRGYVWNDDDKVDLIHSIFNNISIGIITLVRRSYSNKEKLYEVLDGKQRIKTLLDFYEDRFKYRGKTFSELSRRDQNIFKNFSLLQNVLVEPTQKQKLECFIKMNTTGKVMSKEDIERAVNLMEENIESNSK